MNNDSTLILKLPKELHDKLRKDAENKSISVASLVRIILNEYVKE